MDDTLQQEQNIDNNSSNHNNNNNGETNNEATKLELEKKEFLSNDDSTVYSSSVVDSLDNDDIENPVTNLEVQKMDVLQNFFKGDSNIQALGNIQISDSQHIHIGNIMYVSGPLHITSASGTSKFPDNMQIFHTGNVPQTAETPTFNNVPSAFVQVKREAAQMDKKNNSESDKDQTSDSNALQIINRGMWFAMPTIDIELTKTPVPYVVIAHTATEITTTQAETAAMVRNIQAYHVNSMDWDEIGYTFLIGGDGNIYEGRGWGTVGAHTYGYNRISVGIAFIGCFMNILPPNASLEACKLLIQKGVSEGHVSADYKLLGHCQCTPIESPGRMLYNEIQKWPHWFNIGKK